MTLYLVCQKKRNTPRVDIRVCEAKCRHKEACQEYLVHAKSPRAEDPLPSQLSLTAECLPTAPESRTAA